MQHLKLQDQLKNLTEEEQQELFQVEELESRLEMAVAWNNVGCYPDPNSACPKDQDTGCYPPPLPTDNGCDPPES